MTKSRNAAPPAVDGADVMSIRIGHEAPSPTPVRAPITSSAAPAAGPDAARARGDPPASFARVLEAIGREATHGEAAAREAIRATSAGRDLSTAELLALQSDVYRYSETIDLAAKLVDRATNAVKTVVSGQ